ncbi:uncharacterized protein LOC120556731 [Perca fluviatilis]|uniref:uncharacterized protein LOC120556731 n=1 Tax=Perca fluviatilis TaxID=8168 RepID=UPI001962AB0A|nr:uncharacterized protein LOC120556731 [Perca fluviatilis]
MLLYVSWQHDGLEPCATAPAAEPDSLHIISSSSSREYNPRRFYIGSNFFPGKVTVSLAKAPSAHRTEPTATVSRPAEPDDSSGIVASVKARLKAPLPAPSSSSAQMICGLQHVESGCRHVVLNCDKHRVQPNIPAAVAMETEDHCPVAVVATDSQETSEDPVGVVLITQLEWSFSRALKQFPVPAVPAHSCYRGSVSWIQVIQITYLPSSYRPVNGQA